jgi:alpha-glucosidase
MLELNLEAVGARAPTAFNKNMRIERLLFRVSVFPPLRWMLVLVALGFLDLSGVKASVPDMISSPDGNVVGTVNVAGSSLVYSVTYKGMTVIEESPLGLAVNNTNVGTGVSIGGSSAYATNETFASRSGIHAMATNWYQGQVIPITHTASGISYNLDFRVYNNGVAFRYELNGAGTQEYVEGESSGFVTPTNGSLWFITNNIPFDEWYYVPTNIDYLPAGTVMKAPVVIQLSGTNGYLALTESTPGIFGAPSLQKVADATGRLLQVRYPTNFDGSTGASIAWALNNPWGASVTGAALNTPWNVIMIGADLTTLMNNDIVESLAPPPDPTLFPQGTATGWATMGKSVWDYINPWPGGITMTNAMTNSFWAQRLGFQYNLVDAGWSSWNGGNPWPQVAQLVAYSHSLGIRVLLWLDSSGLESEAQRTAFYQNLVANGVDGFKADFWNWGPDLPDAADKVELQEAVLKEAAADHLVVLFHGIRQPMGEFRTYPNLIQWKALMARDYYPQAWQATTIPLIRWLAGPADYGPENGAPYDYETASMVNMPGPVIILTQRSDGIAENPFASLIASIPNEWDQTLVLPQSQLGQTGATARRKGQDWYVGVMNGNLAPPEIWNIPLTFLGSNLLYQADIIWQGASQLQRTNVTSASVFNVTNTTPNGGLSGAGFVAHVYPTPASPGTNYILTGSIIGTHGSWSNDGSTITNLFDGNLNTFFDGPDASGDWAGLDLGSGNQNIVSMIRYCPRLVLGMRMIGGQFQGANTTDFSNPVTLATVGYYPEDGVLTTVVLTNNNVFRYVRYLGPANGYCNIAEVQFYGGTNPPAPTGVSVSPGLNQIALNWNASTGMVYTVLRSTNSGGPYAVISTNLALSGFTDTNLISGQTYYYVISAMNPVGVVSADSGEVNAIAGGPPAVPTALNALAGTNQTVTLSWNAALNTSGYQVERSIVSGGPYSVVASQATTNFTDTGLANGVTYYYVISAANAQGVSVNSPEVAATPGDYGAWVCACGPLGYWQMNEAGGATAIDSSGNGFNGTYKPAVTLGLPGVANPPCFGFASGDLAASFNGQVNSWVSLPGLNLNSASVTFMAWIYPAAATQSGAAGLIFCRDGLGTVSGFDFNPAGNELGYTWNNDSGTFGWNSGLTPPANQWSFAALVVTPSSATIYLGNTNGLASASLTHTHAPSAFSGETRIGNDSYNASRTFKGCLCGAAVFNQALASNQIATLYQSAAGLFYNPTLVGTWNGAQLILAWQDNGLLLQATNVAGPWTTNLAAIPPSAMAPTGALGFFRIRVK